MSGLNAVAKPIEQSDYLASPAPQIEKRQHSWPDGRLYDGQWLQDQPHGQGMLTYADGGQYWGRFHLGKRQGEGLMKFTNGDEYEGEWLHDQPHGQGVMRYADGARHEGQFKQGQPSGQGRRTYPDGTYYDGQWRQSVPHGFGRLTFLSGGAYDGQFHQGKPNGQGTYYFANGDLYEGEWKDGLQEGVGRFNYATGGFYEGQVVRGKRQGKGIWVSALGQRYEGSFSGNKPHGSGRCGTLAQMERCTYRHGKRIESVRIAPVAVAASQPASMANVGHMMAMTTPVAAAVASSPMNDATSASSASVTRQERAIPAAKAAANPATTVAVRTKGAEFTQTLVKEKQRQQKTIADLNPNRSDIHFSDNWPQQQLMAKPGRVWWKKTASLFQDQLEILSQHGDTRILMVIDHYEGPGHYTLSRVRVESPSQSFEADRHKLGQVDIQSDDGGWISGQFQFNVQTDNGRSLDIRDGVFRISEVSSQPRFLR